MLIRRETPADVPAARAVIAAAFAKPDAPGPGGGPAPDPVEATLLDALRTCDGWIPQLSFVAVDAQDGGPTAVALAGRDEVSATDGARVRGKTDATDEADATKEADATDEVVGHVVCTRGHIDGAPALGLGPIGVRPDRQGRGVGLALVHAVLGAADALGEPLVALLGSPAYYGRFGFRPSSELGILAPDPAWGEYFQVRTLTSYGSHDSGEPALRGTFRYAEPFDHV